MEATIVKFDIGSLKPHWGKGGRHSHIANAIRRLRVGQAVIWDSAPPSVKRGPSNHLGYPEILRAAKTAFGEGGRIRTARRDGTVYIVRVA